MSKKLSVIISAVLIVLLIILIVCEKKWPEAGSSLLGSIVL